MGTLCDMKMRFLCEANKTTANGAYSRHQIVVPTRSQSRIPCFWKHIECSSKRNSSGLPTHLGSWKYRSILWSRSPQKIQNRKNSMRPGPAPNIWQQRLRDQPITIKLVLLPQHELILTLVKNELSCDAIENSCCEWLYLIPIHCEYPLGFY